MSFKWISMCFLAACSSVFAAACVVDAGESVEEADQAIGEFCGGIAAIQCPSGLVCVDDPHDNCDPRIGADCGGICVKPKKQKGCDYADPTRTWVSQDPNQCASIRFFCESGTPFFDACGCGCQL